MTAPVLIYDGKCPYCSTAAVALKRLDDVVAISWYDHSAGRFLDAQFGERPFAMFFVDPRECRVYAGESAAKELATRAGTPAVLGSLVGDNYDRILSTVGTLTGRDRDVADYHGTYDLAANAADLVEELRAAAEDEDAPVPDRNDADAAPDEPNPDDLDELNPDDTDSRNAPN